ncbi:carbohydrate ABC transporter permease [Nakamurella leprariae]|uniref:Sugar ABC transporter permease n=1 Tax=Nakamurella leprariae TaxID=2803911 RepID=A0A938YJ06_9ACTN|nr:sugar ABC transporter permease [Nakamurella leprariae]MBM9469034.1 sugar ABC transporter permease [Nakamurella leprariae]
MSIPTTAPTAPEGSRESRADRRRRGTDSRTRGDRRFTLALVAPAVLVVAALFAYPIGYAVWLSTHQWNDKISPRHPYIGVRNYTTLFESGEFWDAMGRTAFFSVITVIGGVALALGLAILLNQDFKGRTLARVLLLVPWAVPPVVNGIMWRLIFDGDNGIANTILRNLGIIDENVQWLADPDTAMNVLIFAEMWKLLPFLTLLLMASLQNIPRNLYRAAGVDGANAWKRFLHITLPGVKGALMFALIVQSMWSIKVFDTIYVLTGGSGGPAGGTTTINFLGYLTTFSNLDRGYGAAIAVVIMVLVILTTLFWILLLGRPAGGPSRWRRKPGATADVTPSLKEPGRDELAQPAGVAGESQ